MLMNNENPRWNEFLWRLDGPEGCNFTKDEKGEFTFRCDGSNERPLATKILISMGFNQDEIKESLAWMHALGGHCDCEILLNVAE